MHSHRILVAWIVIGAISLAGASDTKELPGWEAKPEQSSLPMGVYVSAITMNFGQIVVVRADGTFESRFAGETHRKGDGASWTKFEFAGSWRIENGQIAFRYRDRSEERTETFSIGVCESKPAFRFSRPEDSRCAFVAELFVLELNRPNQQPQRNAGSRPSSNDSPASETPSSPGPRG